jgi:hypothetical protein
MSFARPGAGDDASGSRLPEEKRVLELDGSHGEGGGQVLRTRLRSR